MKVLILLIFMFICLSGARQLVSLDETGILFKKFVLNELSEAEASTLKELFQLLRRPKYVAATQREIKFTASRTAYNRNLICILCRSTLNALFEGIAEGQTDEQLEESITTLCVEIGIQNRNVCTGAVKLNLPLIIYIIRNTPEAAPMTYCSLLLQNSESNVCPHNDTRFEWQVDLPPPPEFVPTPLIDTSPIKVAVVTDAHIDPLYEANGVANCDEPTCCRVGQKPAPYMTQNDIDDNLYENAVVERDGEKMFNLSLAREIQSLRSQSIVARQNAEPAGYWGDYRNCDSPIWAYDDLIERIAEAHKDIDFVYYVGDTIDHGVWETSYELIKAMHRHLVEKMKSSFGEKLVIPTIGNHESHPTNQFAPNYIVGEFNTTWLYEALADKWGSYLPEEARASLLKTGEFVMKPRRGLKVIVINNNVAYKYNWWLVFDPADAKRHLDWLIQELRESELAGEKVHILSHIPPGTQDLTHTWTREYNRIVNRFSSTIAAEFNGHVHYDEFKLFYSPDGAPVNVAWGGGAATAYTKYNMNYKIVEFDSSTFQPVSMECYTYNVTEANLTPNRRPHWFLLYDFKNSFDLPDLSPISIDNLVNAMSSNAHYLDLYSAYSSRLSDARWPACDQACKMNYLCSSVITVLWEREKCEEITALINLK
ncbi:sphingomyelin phosphodiesterase 1-like [Plodia interpunctella]|uniref:sphingomyelin phosphodiesterase 1-like n=1 Tax=Plodia interpunctella TaxID=58824 RepID=UPI0023683449|nr:sphingomyelin phosphodiesterase 1-like [Plodia interpunctella]